MGQTQPPPHITTPRLYLRPPTQVDAARLTDLMGDLDVARMTARTPHPYGVSDAKAFIAQANAQGHGIDRVFAIHFGSSGLVGCIGLFTSDRGRPEIGYWIGKPFWGQGLATEALGALQNWAAVHLGLRYLTAGYFADNPSSGVVLTKAGFLLTGEVQTLFSKARQELVQCKMAVWLA